MKRNLLRISLLFAAGFLTNQSLNAQTYCTPEFMVGCDDGNTINDFVLTGESGTEISDMGTGCSSGSYDDKTSMTPVELNPGQTYTAKMSTGIAPDVIMPGMIESGMHAVIWIDFNNDGTFDISERVAYFNNYLETSLTDVPVTIPNDAEPGLHRMRVAVGLSTFMMGQSLGSIDDIIPCPSLMGGGGSMPFDMGGEIHDYMISIPGSVNCDDFHVNLGADTTICSNANLVLDATIQGATSYSWNTGASNASITVSQAGTYTVTISNGNCDTTASILVNVQSLPTVNEILVTHNGGNSYTFTANGASNVDTYSWDFGDGTSETGGATVTHTYSDNSNYNVILIYANNCGTDMVVSSVSTAGINDILNNSITVYPNPAKDVVNVTIDNEIELISIELFNLLGQKIKSASTTNIQLTDINAGTYILRVNTTMGELNQTLIVE